MKVVLQFFDLWDESINSICQSVKFADKNIGILKKKMKQKCQDLFTGELGICKDVFTCKRQSKEIEMHVL